MQVQKLGVIQTTQKNLAQVLWKNMNSRDERGAQNDFEILLDCLIFFILKNANIKN